MHNELMLCNVIIMFELYVVLFFHVFIELESERLGHKRHLVINVCNTCFNRSAPGLSGFLVSFVLLFDEDVTEFWI